MRGWRQFGGVWGCWMAMAMAVMAAGQPTGGVVSLEAIVLKEVAETEQGTPKITSTTLVPSGAPLFEVPQAVEVMGQEYIRERNPSSMYEILDYVSGVFTGGRTPMQRTAGQVRMRGYSGSEVMYNRFVLPGVMSYYLDAAAIERVEFVKGPVGEVLGGRTSTLGPYGMGGSVNIVSKTPQTENFLDGHLTARGADGVQMYRVAGDWNRVLTDRALLRVNAAAETEKNGWLPEEMEWGRSLFVAPSLLLKAWDRAVVRYDGNVQWSDTPSYQGTPIFNGEFVFGRDQFYGTKDSRTELFGTTHQLSLSAALSESFSVQAGLSLSLLSLDREYWSAASADRASGRSSMQLYRQMLATGKGPLAYGDSSGDSRNYGAYVTALKEVETGEVTHRLAVGGDWLRKDAKSDGVSGITPDVDLTHPDYSVVKLTPSESESTLDRFGVLAQDLMSWKNLRILLGGRVDEHMSAEDNRGEGWNGQAGVTWLVASRAAVYGNYTYASAPAFGYIGLDGEELTDAWSAQMAEVGVKANPWSDFWLSLALFNLRQDNMPEITLEDATRYELGAESESKGVEATAEGHVLPWWTFRASYTYTDYEDKEALNPAQSFPPHSVVLWNTFELPADMFFSVGYRWQDGFDATFRGDYLGPEFYVPSAERVDIALEIPVRWAMFGRHGTVVRLAVQNLFDEDYVESVRHAVEAFPGENRTFEIGLRGTF